MSKPWLDQIEKSYQQGVEDGAKPYRDALAALVAALDDAEIEWGKHKALDQAHEAARRLVEP